ncbi:hypothetical protein [Gudongella sp. SC589]|jgi:hypothetical protein|uniref:hypothetical protein n=1 Tax=Gudongella sp. SC589 TaxID=3385990 RepID=UPI003904B792
MLKKILIPIGAVILVLTLVVYMNQGLFKMGVNYIKYRYFSEDRVTENFREVQENPFEKYLLEEEDPLEEVEKSTEISHEGTDGDIPTQEIAEQVAPSSPTNSQSPTPKPSEAPASKPTLAQISREYMLEFEEMEINFRSNLEGLVKEAVRDYNSGQYRKSKLAEMYLQEGEKMELESDRRFYKLLANLEQKLVQSSFGTDMVRDVESYYIKMKEYEKNRIIDKGMALLKD